MRSIRNVSAAFTGGALGAAVDSFNIWALGKLGISDLIGISMQPEFTGPWLGERMVWGGLWMLLLLLPVMKDRTVARGMAASLLPSAFMLFVVLPSMGKGMLGLGFGNLMPVVVVVLNFIYGIVASYWYSSAADQGRRAPSIPPG